jgi:hypothetical protein
MRVHQTVDSSTTPDRLRCPTLPRPLQAKFEDSVWSSCAHPAHNSSARRAYSTARTVYQRVPMHTSWRDADGKFDSAEVSVAAGDPVGDESAVFLGLELPGEVNGVDVYEFAVRDVFVEVVAVNGWHQRVHCGIDD